MFQAEKLLKQLSKLANQAMVLSRKASVQTKIRAQVVQSTA